MDNQASSGDSGGSKLAADQSPRFVPQVITRIATFLPMFGRIACKNVSELFDEIADDRIANTLGVPKFSCFLVDIQSLVRQRDIYKDPDYSVMVTTTERYQEYLLDLLEMYCGALPEVTAFFVNVNGLVGKEKECTRLKQIISNVCAQHAAKIERFGCLHYMYTGDITMEGGMHFDAASVNAVYSYNDIVEWIRNMPRLSVLYLPSMRLLKRTGEWGEDVEPNALPKSDDEHRHKIEEIWKPLKPISNTDALPLRSLRHIHFCESPDVIQSCMGDFVAPFAQVELVTLPPVEFDADDDITKNAAVRKTFPHALILPRCMNFTSGIDFIFGDALYGTREECDAVLDKTLRIMKRAVSDNIQSIFMRLPMIDLEELNKIGVTNLQPLLEFASRTPRVCMELDMFDFTPDLRWAAVADIIKHWQKPRHRRCRFSLSFAQNAGYVGDDDDDMDNMDDHLHRSLKDIWYARDAGMLRVDQPVSNYADAYYMDVINRRYKWLHTCYRLPGDDGKSVSGDLDDDDDDEELDVDDYDDYDDYDADDGEYDEPYDSDAENDGYDPAEDY